MEPTQTSAAPLSPFMWNVPKRLITTPGSLPGGLGHMRQFIADLSVNFDLIVQEFAPPYEHAVYDIFMNHPLHTCALNKRQFDVLRYGMVLDTERRLVIMEATRECADAGALLDREYNAIFKPRPTTCSEISTHPLLPEYSLIVVRLPKEDEAQNGAAPDLLFRMIFRNEAYQELNTPVPEKTKKFPLFRLRSVLVPSVCYETMNEVYRYRAGHPGVFTTQAGKQLPNPKIEQLLRSSPVGDLCDAWVSVVNGIAPQWVCEKGLGPDVVALFLKDPDDTVAHQDDEKKEKLPVLDNRVRLNYTENAQRMQQRVRVIRREAGLISRWRDGEFDIAAYDSEELTGRKRASTVTEPQMDKATCVRMLMRLTRSGVNSMEDDEICAFIPEEREYAEQRVYRTKAAEKLRLWVLKGLVTAEKNGVHALLIDVDPTMLLAQCVGLLHGEEDEEGTTTGNSGSSDRSRESLFHICKIVVETVEDYVQHSGVVWQVTLAVSEEGVTKKAVSLCEEILKLTQLSKARMEKEEKDRFEGKGDDYADAERNNATAQSTAAGDGSKKDGTQGNSDYYERAYARAMSARSGALVVRDENQIASTASFYNLRGTIPHYLADRANALGYQLIDEQLFPLFESLCAEGEHTVPVKSIVHILQDKLDGDDRKDSVHGLLSNPLLSVDSCGIPHNERSITNFVMGFSTKPYRSMSTHSATEETLSLNYVEFSMMMLALARQ